jgi:PhzF family phenazine biosynthesis protein
LWPDYDRIGALLAGQTAIVLYVVAVDPGAESARARSFAGSAEIGEDPATGAAAGALMAHAHARAGVERLDIVQGVEMGRPSQLTVSVVPGDEGVRVSGNAVAI